MAIVGVNMDEKSTKRSIVPDGTYVVEVLSIEEGQSSQKKSPQLNVTFEVLEGPFEGEKLYDFIPLSVEFRKADFFFAAGIDNTGDVEVDTDALARETVEGEPLNEQGSVLQVRKTTQPEEYNGKKVNSIRLFYDRVAEETEEETPAPKAAAAAPKRKTATPRGRRTINA